MNFLQNSSNWPIQFLNELYTFSVPKSEIWKYNIFTCSYQILALDCDLIQLNFWNRTDFDLVISYVTLTNCIINCILIHRYICKTKTVSDLLIGMLVTVLLKFKFSQICSLIISSYHCQNHYLSIGKAFLMKCFPPDIKVFYDKIFVSPVFIFRFYSFLVF